MRPVRQLVYAAVSRRAKGRCELCHVEWERQTGQRLDPHHVFGRAHLIPSAVAETAECVLGVCRPCHERIHLGDLKLEDKARRLAFARFTDRWDLPWVQLLDEAGGDALDAMRAACRLLSERDEPGG